MILMVRERKSRRKSFIYLLWLFNSNEFINHSTEIGLCLVVDTSCFCNFGCCLCFTSRDIVLFVGGLNEMIANWLCRYFIVVVEASEMLLIAVCTSRLTDVEWWFYVLTRWQTHSRVVHWCMYIEKCQKTVVYVSYFITLYGWLWQF